ncbi:MAG: DUF424 family protein [archaeon]
MTLLVKIHKATRYVVAICDKDIFGQKFLDADNIRQIDLTTSFFQGEEKSEEEVEEIMLEMVREDASFNLVGEKTCEIALKTGLVDKESVTRIANIPVALTLL